MSSVVSGRAIIMPKMPNRAPHIDNDSRMICQGRKDPVEDFGSHKRTRAIMDQDKIGIGQAKESVGDGMISLCSATDDPGHFGKAVGINDFFFTIGFFSG